MTQSLQQSITQHGLKNPILVQKIGNGRYRLIDGKSRFGCVTTPTIACYVLDRDGQRMNDEPVQILKTKIGIPKR